MEYLLVHFPDDRSVVIDNELQGRTNETIEVEAGTHVISLKSPPDFPSVPQYLNHVSLVENIYMTGSLYHNYRGNHIIDNGFKSNIFFKGNGLCSTGSTD